jgi:hypothetical protein
MDSTFHIEPVTLRSPQSQSMPAARSRRIWLLLAAVWLMNTFDLGFTLHAHNHGLLVEQNPVALAVLPHGPAALVLFKVALVGFSTAVLAYNRRELLVECAVWAAAAAYVGVSLRWMLCYEVYQTIVSTYRFPPALGPA